MPQLDPTFFPSQLFWLAISFGLLFVLLKFWALPGVSQTIEKRQDKIDEDLSQATKHQKEIEVITEKCEVILKKSRQDAHDLLVKKAEEMKLFNAEKEKELAEKLNVHLKNTELKVQKAKDEAMKEVEKLVVDLSQDLSFKLTGSRFPSEIVTKLANEGITKNRGHA